MIVWYMSFGLASRRMTRSRYVLPTYQCSGHEYFIGERITMRTIILSALLLSCCGENTVRVSGYGKRSPNEQDISRPYFKRRPTPTPAPTMRPTPTPTAYPQQPQQQQQHPANYYRCKCGKVQKVCGKDEVLSGYCYIIYGE
jgi:hypothetical protein